MDLGSLMQGLSSLAGPQAAALGAKVGLAPEQVTEILGHLDGQATSGQTDPHAAAAVAASHTGIDPGMVMGVVGALMSGGGVAGLTAALDRNHDGSAIDDVMGMAKGLFNR